MNSSPLGVFDSGLGGLSVVRALWDVLPEESVVYFGDTGRFPYGTRSPDVIREFSRQAASFLLSQNCKAVVVACNTASAHALDDLAERLDVPVLGVVEPGVSAALAARREGRIGLLATAGTVASGAYNRALSAKAPSLKLTSVSAPLFVSLVEEGWVDTPATRLIAEEYLKPFSRAAHDVVILGCTHFPVLNAVLGEILGNETSLVDGSRATAQATLEMLKAEGLRSENSNPEHRFFVSDAPQKFATLGRLFLGKDVGLPERISIDEY